MTSPGLIRFAETVEARIGTLLIVAGAIAGAGLVAPVAIAERGLFAAAVAVALFAALMSGLALLSRRRRGKTLRSVSGLIANDGAPTILAGADGAVQAVNAAARTRFGDELCETLSGALGKSLANPGGTVFRMQTLADKDGFAHEDMITRRGQVRLSVNRVASDAYLWRVEEMGGAAQPSDGPALPMLMTGRTGAVLYMNEAARQLAGGRVKSLDRLFVEPEISGGMVCDLSGPEGKSRVLIAEVDAGAGRRALYLLPPPEGESVSREGWNVFMHLPVPLLKVGTDGEVQAFNRMAETLIGTSLSDGVPLSELMEGLGRSMTDWLGEAISGRLVQHSEFLRLKRADREVFVKVTLNRVSDEGAPALIVVLHDATALKTLEAQFVQSQKMQAIGQLAGGVAHDFNNLLTAISGHCDLLLLRHDQGDPDYSDLVQINQNANRAAALVGQLLAFSRKQTLRPETLDMRDTLSDLTHLLNRLVGEKITLTLSHEPVLPSIRADKRQLEQVMMNLVVNARDAMQQGGEIRIVTEAATLTEPLERDRASVPPGRYVTVTVSDEGVGIAQDKLQKVFEPFFTTKRTGEGTGLGLSTAYGIVKQTGGYIFVDSTVGSGTCFTLYFPVLEETETERSAPPAALPKPGPKHRDGVILLVEDEAPVRAFASRALRLRGYTVLEADSAEAALKTLEDRSLSIDVFVTDVVMPGMDGPSWVREALKDRPGVRVVFVSGYAEDSFGETQVKIPNSVFLPKPFSLNDLTETVHRQLH
ncbi:ATP-binding protein [Sulfitobacter sp. D35]|uniref:hybrid sensor histidine kinase/response regulator n=1 Tax=Sulfitobacter sp. D35 TaxID=3083252 RepID=UPI00296EA004|nr:ATP-binding protein [Sulfitobacter sp. D35]MDW4497835.1 ATP-binding protein [Sulfitobacter sp. D35]